MSWRRDREELTAGVADLVAWRREKGFPPDTDEEMVNGVLNLVEGIRIRNMRRFQQAIEQAVSTGTGTKEATMDLLRAYLRNTEREIADIEAMAEEEDRRYRGTSSA